MTRLLLYACIFLLSVGCSVERPTGISDDPTRVKLSLLGISKAGKVEAQIKNIDSNVLCFDRDILRENNSHIFSTEIKKSKNLSRLPEGFVPPLSNEQIELQPNDEIKISTEISYKYKLLRNWNSGEKLPINLTVNYKICKNRAFYQQNFEFKEYIF